VIISFHNYLFKADNSTSCIYNFIVLSAQQKCFPYLDYFLITESVWPNKNFMQSNSDDSNVDILVRFI
jgi:hypothetical protein